MMEQYLQRVIWNNQVIDYLYALAAIIIVWVVLQIIKKWVIATLRKFSGRSKTQFDDVLISGFEKFVIPYIYILLNFAIIDQLKLSAGANKVLDVAITVITVFFGARFINYAMHVSLNMYMQRREEAASRILQMNGILNIFKVFVWALGFLFLLDNLGYDVTTIITGLGIGGIAIALAAQNILGDLFSYFVIFFDKPFEIGDSIVLGDKNGTVEQIGIKTSRLRTVSGEELVMPNAELVKSPIHNFKRMATRRIQFTLRVAYSTPAEVLKQIPSIIKNIISSKESVVFDRAHLQALADYFINYEVVYTIVSADYNLFMDIHQAVCLELVEAFRNQGIEFAIPTQRVFAEGLESGGKEEKPVNEILLT